MFAQAQRAATQRIAERGTAKRGIARMAGAAAVIAAALQVAPAAAQSGRYCDGNLVANAFYSNVQSNGTTATVEYHGQFQNMDPQRRRLVATLLRLQTIGPFTVLRPMGTLTLNSYEQRDVVVLALQTNNASGSGAPTPAAVGATIRFACHFAP